MNVLLHKSNTIKERTMNVWVDEWEKVVLSRAFSFVMFTNQVVPSNVNFFCE